MGDRYLRTRQYPVIPGRLSLVSEEPGTPAAMSRRPWKTSETTLANECIRAAVRHPITRTTIGVCGHASIVIEQHVQGFSCHESEIMSCYCPVLYVVEFCTHMATTSTPWCKWAKSKTCQPQARRRWHRDHGYGIATLAIYSLQIDTGQASSSNNTSCQDIVHASVVSRNGNDFLAKAWFTLFF